MPTKGAFSCELFNFLQQASESLSYWNCETVNCFSLLHEQLYDYVSEKAHINDAPQQWDNYLWFALLKDSQSETSSNLDDV